MKDQQQKISTLYLIIVILILLIGIQYRQNRGMQKPVIISDKIENGYHVVQFSFRDTLQVDSMNDARYNELLTKLEH